MSLPIILKELSKNFPDLTGDPKLNSYTTDMLRLFWILLENM